VLGIIVLGVGLHSHFQSAWVKDDAYKICDVLDVVPGGTDIKCPSLTLEQYYVSMIIICFILSLASILIDTTTGTRKLVVSLELKSYYIIGI